MKAYLACKSIDHGMFPGEITVLVEAHPQDVSFFLPLEKVRQKMALKWGRIEVELLDYNDDYALVQLPVCSIEGGNTVKVSRVLIAMNTDQQEEGTP